MPNDSGLDADELKSEEADSIHQKQIQTNYHKLSQLFGHLLRAWLDILFWEHYPGGRVRTSRLCSQTPNAQDLAFQIHNVYSDGAVLASLSQDLQTIYIHISPFTRAAEVLHLEHKQRRLQVYRSQSLETGVGFSPNLRLRKELNKKLELMLANAIDQGHVFVHPPPTIDFSVPRDEWKIILQNLLKKCPE
ncbi:MAG: hypothetical protein ACXACI_15455 [Candidatus Hodarchaeales archaeon]|jgi:hypothetical protein